MANTYNREDLTEGDVCMWCKKDLRTVDEIHAVEGHHFCSKDCAIASQAEIIAMSAKELATEWYNDCAEIVTPSDIGLCKEELWTLHDGDITVIFKSIYAGAEITDNLLSTEVTGFYFGVPDDKLTELYNGKLKADYK